MFPTGCITAPQIEPARLAKATAGDPQAQYEIGEQYRDAYFNAMTISSIKSGKSLWEQAADWYEMAATQGHPKAQFRLSFFYFTIRSDYDKSFYWTQKAAQHGVAEAQHFLGLHYGQAWGTPQDLVLAYKWMALAFEGNVSNPIGKLASLEWLINRGHMSHDQITQGQRLADDHTATYGPSRSITLPEPKATSGS